MSESTQATETRLTESVADEIRALIARRRLSAAKLAQELGWSQPYMARRMTGTQSFDLNDLQQLARVLKVKVSDLIAHAESGGETYSRVGNSVPDVHGVFISELPRGPIIPAPRGPVTFGDARRGSRSVRNRALAVNA